MIFSLGNILEINLYGEILRRKMAEDSETQRNYGGEGEILYAI